MNITVTDDDELEGDEMFNITLVVPPSVDSRIVAGNRTSATAVITDASSMCYNYIRIIMRYLAILYCHSYMHVIQTYKELVHLKVNYSVCMHFVSVCALVHAWVRVCVFVCVCVCVCATLCAHVGVSVCAYVHMCDTVCVCAMRVCACDTVMCVCVCVCVHVFHVTVFQKNNHVTTHVHLVVFR